MIQLTPEQAQTLDTEGQPQRVVDPRTNAAYVLLREEEYQKLQAYYDGELDMIDVGQLVNEAMREDDANDPTLEYYQQMYGKKA
jgi:hypothetical protein